MTWNVIHRHSSSIIITSIRSIKIVLPLSASPRTLADKILAANNHKKPHHSDEDSDDNFGSGQGLAKYFLSHQNHAPQEQDEPQLTKDFQHDVSFEPDATYQAALKEHFMKALQENYFQFGDYE